MSAVQPAAEETTAGKMVTTMSVCAPYPPNLPSPERAPNALACAREANRGEP